MEVGYKNSGLWEGGNFFLPGTSSLAPYNDDKLFYASAAGGGVGRWYFVKQIDHTEDDWQMVVWDGIIPADNSTTESGWGAVTIEESGAQNNCLSTKETDRVMCAWDDKNMILHYCLVHFSGSQHAEHKSHGVRYNNIKMTPSLNSNTDDTWIGNGSDSNKHIINENFCNVLYNYNSTFYDATDDAYWPIQGDRFSIAVEPQSPIPRVWVSFLWNSNVYANCSISADYKTWTVNDGDADWDGDATGTKASSTIGDYILIKSNTGLAPVADAGVPNDEHLHNDSQAKLVAGITSGSPFIACVYNDSGSSGKWMIAQRAVTGNPSAPTWGGSTDVQIALESGGLSHEMNIRSHVPLGGNTSILTFASADSAHNVRVAVRDASAVWTTHLITESTDRGYPQMVGDPTTGNLFLFAANHGLLLADAAIPDYSLTCLSYDMRVMNMDDLSDTISSWSTVLKKGENEDADVLAPIPVVGKTSPTERAGIDGSTPWLDDSGLMVLTLVPTTPTVWKWTTNYDPNDQTMAFVWNNIDVSTFEADVAGNEMTNITLTSPTAGQTLAVGETLTITWTTN